MALDGVKWPAVSVCLFFAPASILVCVHNTKFAASQKQVIDQIINNSLIVSFVRVREREIECLCVRERDAGVRKVLKAT